MTIREILYRYARKSPNSEAEDKAYTEEAINEIKSLLFEALSKAVKKESMVYMHYDRGYNHCWDDCQQAIKRVMEGE